MARPRGALPEIVRAGIDGFFGDDVRAMAAHVDRVADLDRQAIRESVIERFSVELGRATRVATTAPISATMNAASVRPGADVVTLVKPQFEAGRDEVGKHGVVRDEGVRARVLAEIVAVAEELGLRAVGHTASPIEGMEGNLEWLAHFRSRA